MPRAFHHGGPADGATVPIDDVAAFGYHAPAEERVSTGWVSLARYVFMPPRIKARCNYRYTGEHQVQGPVKPADEAPPEWS